MKVRKEKFKPSNMCKSYTNLQKKFRLTSLIVIRELNYSKNIDDDNVYYIFFMFIF